jgi:molybdopterin synthase catalytic subunit
MRVEVLPFGVLKDTLKGPAVLELPESATVADLLSVVAGKVAPDARSRALLCGIAVSVNAEYAQKDHRLKDGDRVGLLPPVSGGRESSSPASTSASILIDAPGVLTFLTRDPIRANDLVSNAKMGQDGAVVVFDGIVRDNARGRRTLYLDYEAYEEMASAEMHKLAAEAKRSFGVRAVTIVHRLGRLYVGETSVLIVVCSAHRAHAFEASRWLIDTLKKTIPIWKKEMFADGAAWADGEPFPAEVSAGVSIDSHADSDGNPSSPLEPAV